MAAEQSNALLGACVIFSPHTCVRALRLTIAAKQGVGGTAGGLVVVERFSVALLRVKEVLQCKHCYISTLASFAHDQRSAIGTALGTGVVHVLHSGELSLHQGRGPRDTCVGSPTALQSFCRTSLKGA